MFNNPLQMILIGLGMLVTGFVVLRGGRKLQQSRGRNLLNESKQEIIRTEQTVESRVQKMEVRLLEYQREVEGQVSTKMATLQQLVLSAETQISRLEELLKSKDQPADLVQKEVRNSRQFMVISQLDSAGFSTKEIACMVKASPEEVEALIQGGKESGNDPDNNQVA